MTSKQLYHAGPLDDRCCAWYMNSPGAQVEQRQELGHEEGDTIVGNNQDGFLVTLEHLRRFKSMSILLATLGGVILALAIIGAIALY
ncbi:MAG: hypothetical protein R6W89_11400, partial [Candidatus Hydrogenedentota bacterium]